MVAFWKRSKEYGGYRDDGKNVSLGYLGCSESEEYFMRSGIQKVEVGDSVLNKEHPQGFCFESEEDIIKYATDKERRVLEFTGTNDYQEATRKLYSSLELSLSENNPFNDGVRYLITEKRLHQILTGIEDWKGYKSEEDVELVEEQLEELNKYILPKVDFETENLYFAYC